MKTEKYLIHGTYNVEASLGPNSASAIQKGKICVSLPGLGMNIYCYAPTAVVSVPLFRKVFDNLGYCYGQENVQLVQKTQTL